MEVLQRGLQMGVLRMDGLDGGEVHAARHQRVDQLGIVLLAAGNEPVQRAQVLAHQAAVLLVGEAEELRGEPQLQVQPAAVAGQGVMAHAMEQLVQAVAQGGDLGVRGVRGVHQGGEARYRLGEAVVHEPGVLALAAGVEGVHRGGVRRMARVRGEEGGDVRAVQRAHRVGLRGLEHLGDQAGLLLLGACLSGRQGWRRRPAGHQRHQRNEGEERARHAVVTTGASRICTAIRRRPGVRSCGPSRRAPPRGSPSCGPAARARR